MREDALDNVPVHLKGVLGAIRDPSCRAPHKDFLRCLDRQHIQCEGPPHTIEYIRDITRMIRMMAVSKMVMTTQMKKKIMVMMKMALVSNEMMVIR